MEPPAGAARLAGGGAGAGGGLQGGAERCPRCLAIISFFHPYSYIFAQYRLRFYIQRKRIWLNKNHIFHIYWRIGGIIFSYFNSKIQIPCFPGVRLDQVFSATVSDIVAVTKRTTSGEGGALAASVKSVLIGKVPDRGGRTEGTTGAAVRMPKWSARKK